MKRSSSRDLPPLGLLVFVVGAASLGAEIAAARLMAPFFGASTIVWANMIGVVLVSLAVGYWFGGRFADRHPHKQGLCTLVLVAALAVALIPFVADPFLDISVDALDEVSAGAFIGSLVAVIGAGRAAGDAARRGIAVRDPARGRARRGERHGRGPDVRDLDDRQPRRDLDLGAAAGAAAWARGGRSWSSGSPARWWRSPVCARRAALAVPAAIVALLALPGGHDQGRRRRHACWTEVETDYQYARVVEEPDGERKLELNEGQAVHSLYRPGLLPDRRLLGRVPRAAVRRALVSRRGRWRSSATPPAPLRARSVATSRTRRWTRSRSTRS